MDKEQSLLECIGYNRMQHELTEPFQVSVAGSIITGATTWPTN